MNGATDAKRRSVLHCAHTTSLVSSVTKDGRPGEPRLTDERGTQDWLKTTTDTWAPRGCAPSRPRPWPYAPTLKRPALGLVGSDEVESILALFVKSYKERFSIFFDFAEICNIMELKWIEVISPGGKLALKFLSSHKPARWVLELHGLMYKMYIPIRLSEFVCYDILTIKRATVKTVWFLQQFV